MLRADLLQTPLVKLQQIAAGHFALRLAPSTWTQPGAHRWRRVGQDGVQVSAQEWFQRKLSAHVVSGKGEHEHLVTEQSCKAADLSHSGLVANLHDAASQRLAHMAQDMTPWRQSSLTTTSPTTRSSSCSSSQRALRHDGAARKSKGHFDKLDTNGATAVRAPRMARAWHALMVAAATVSTVLACAVPQRVQPHAVAVPLFGHGGGKVFLKEAFDKGQTISSIQHGQPQRDESLRQSHGTEARILGRPSPARHDGRQILQRNGKQAETRSSFGGKAECRESRKGEQDSGGHQVPDRTQRRSPNTASGFDQAGSTSPCGSHRQDDRRRHQRPLPQQFSMVDSPMEEDLTQQHGLTQQEID